MSDESPARRRRWGMPERLAPTPTERFLRGGRTDSIGLAALIVDGRASDGSHTRELAVFRDGVPMWARSLAMIVMFLINAPALAAGMLTYLVVLLISSIWGGTYTWIALCAAGCAGIVLALPYLALAARAALGGGLLDGVADVLYCKVSTDEHGMRDLVGDTESIARTLRWLDAQDTEQAAKLSTGALRLHRTRAATPTRRRAGLPSPSVRSSGLPLSIAGGVGLFFLTGRFPVSGQTVVKDDIQKMLTDERYATPIAVAIVVVTFVVVGLLSMRLLKILSHAVRRHPSWADPELPAVTPWPDTSVATPVEQSGSDRKGPLSAPSAASR